MCLYFIVCLVLVDNLRPTQQLFRYFGTFSWVEPLLSSEDKVSCSRNEHTGYCKFGNFREIVIFRKLLKDIFAILKIQDYGMIYLYIIQRQSDFAISRGFYFQENSHNK